VKALVVSAVKEKLIRLVELLEHLSRLPSGPIENVDALADLLATCWDDFCGSDSEGMTAEKLRRIEQVEWTAPMLTFVIERHGGTVRGSTRGELHRWTVDVRRGTADCSPCGYRQLHDRDKPLHTGPLVAEIVALIASGSNDPRLKWSSDRRSVHVLVGDFITGEYKQTQTDRRKRFRTALERELQSADDALAEHRCAGCWTGL
jgi:hypothetical protein